MNQKTKDFLRILDGKPTSAPKSKPEPPPKKYTDNASGSYEDNDPNPFKGDRHKTDMAD